MASKEPNSFVFAAVMCLVCGLLLTAASVGLKDRQVKNQRIDRQKNILKALSLLPAGRKATATEVETIYGESVKENWVNPETGGLYAENESGDYLSIYVVVEKGFISRYAIPFEAYGLWSWVKGFFALSGDGKTVTGMTVYSHAETPGLGGEVEKSWFQTQFVGKKITDADGKFVSVGVVKGKVSDRVAGPSQVNFVDGISGATITSKGMEKYIKIELEKYETFSKLLRSTQQ